nr:IPTL-CTERM sorting domain-containing protein [Spirochaetales bacterium]
GLSPITTGGLITGTPTEAGTFTFTVTATDDNGCTGLREYTLVINPADCPDIMLLPTVLPAGTVNTSYSRTITASPAGTYTFAMTSGSLPAGLSPITANGLITGTPTAAGTFTFTVTATDARLCTGLREYTLVINTGAVTPIPTLSEWGMIFFMVLLGLASFYYMRRRKEEI